MPPSCSPLTSRHIVPSRLPPYKADVTATTECANTNDRNTVSYDSSIFRLPTFATGDAEYLQFTSHLTGTTPRLYYKAKPVTAVRGNNSSLSRE